MAVFSLRPTDEQFKGDACVLLRLGLGLGLGAVLLPVRGDELDAAHHDQDIGCVLIGQCLE